MKKLIALIVFGLMLFPTVSAADPDITDFYAVPDEPYEDTIFYLLVVAEDNDGIDEIELSGDASGLVDCNGYETCYAYFEVQENSPGYYDYEIEVWDDEGDSETDDLRVRVLDRDDNDDDLDITSMYATPSRRRRRWDRQNSSIC